ncbi:hypothetical protein HanXRQr2_Chr14g0629721 [Helianthus annuus]|uniref:Uncharacterized protein n=1 Tax=Helianthus annuus TaxID=4232 RepID=A0A9K3E7E9_HELAN|nr:hypothetical protein HanXRQr2_Chr14g0629721 [Helianthus annuus]KAJ0839188.1 hypothetical protein HanPSC8_Chr14g0603921 [Helianthus annuus]
MFLCNLTISIKKLNSGQTLRIGMSLVPTGTENPQKWVPVPNIPGMVRFDTGI